MASETTGPEKGWLKGGVNVAVMLEKWVWTGLWVDTCKKPGAPGQGVVALPGKQRGGAACLSPRVM